MDFSKMMKQAQQLQKQMAEAQRRIEEMQVEGIAGGGMVSVILAGSGKMVSLSINEVLMDDKETDILEDLIIAAYNDAWQKLEKKRAEEMSSVTGGGSFPRGLDFLSH